MNSIFDQLGNRSNYFLYTFLHRRLKRFVRYLTLADELFLQIDKLFYMLMSKHDSFDQFLFFDLIRTTFNHHDRFFGTGNNEIESAGPGFFNSGKHFQFTFDHANPHASNRIRKGHVRQAKCTGG